MKELNFDTFGENKAHLTTNNTDDRLFKTPSIGGYTTIRHYAILRIGEKKFKSLNDIKGFERHMERKQNTPNADTSIENERLIGSTNISEDVKEYIKGISIRKNGVYARELLLAASPNFFKNMSEPDKNNWVQHNIKWLKDNFADNCVYATCHKDENGAGVGAWHIHALIVPRFYDEKRNRYVLANSRYFDGIEKLRSWQSNYANAMNSKYSNLNRGCMFSQAKHTTVKNFYSLINTKLDEKDIKHICEKAKYAELLEKKLIQMQHTLNGQEKYKDKIIEFSKEIQELKQDKVAFRECIKVMADVYKIPQDSIKKILAYVEEKAEKGQKVQNEGRERTR